MFKPSEPNKFLKLNVRAMEMEDLSLNLSNNTSSNDKKRRKYKIRNKEPPINEEDADSVAFLCKMNTSNPSHEPLQTNQQQSQNEVQINASTNDSTAVLRDHQSIPNVTTAEEQKTATAATTTSNATASSKLLKTAHKTTDDSGGGGGGGDGGGGGCGSRKGNSEDEETDVIGDLVGHFGKWQLMMTILLSLFQVPNTFHISSSVYQAANKDFWCTRPPFLQHLDIEHWRNLSRSQDNCHQLAIDWQHLSNETIGKLQEQVQEDSLVSQRLWQEWKQNTTSISCSAWEYETHDNVGNTWTSEWDLVCDKEYLKNVAEMFFLLGVATGGIISGYLSDKFGRKKMLFISAVLQTIFGLVLYFANSFELYITLRALLGLVSVSVTYAGLILAIEYVDGKWRTIAGMYNLFPLPISYMLISGIAYLTQDYQKLQLCIGIPGIFLCFLWFVVPESPRWLLVKGRIDEVKCIVEAAAKFNGRILPDQFELTLKPPTQESSSQDYTRLLRSSYLRRVSICFLLIWFTMNLIYYGLILNMSSFGGNVYVNSALAGLVEIPAIAIAIYIITKVGKKWLFCATLFAAGLACCCAAITEVMDGKLWIKITFLMIGKFTISAGNTIMPVYTAELYPTAIRNVGVGACNVAAGIALIITPYLSLLTKIENHLLMTLLTVMSLFGGIVVLFLPETMSSHAKQNPPEEKC